ncbi:MAG: helix-turn-helix transcriptional regulator [Roseburia faecis]|jgi:AraC-like DNA-binding protein|nr:helix-turn-helix transcriptional regulator [Roseburia faecis]
MPNPIDLDEALFQRIEYYIVHEKMFLQPRLSREDVTDRVYVPRNKFGQLFVRFAGTNFVNYVNNLRLDYAVRLLKEHQEYSVEAVARECGIPAPQTFYRIFVKKYGMTPTEYRKK